MRPMNESTISSAEMSMRARLLDRGGQVVLQCQCGLVLHVDLDGHQQALAHPQDRNALHRCALKPCRV
jgi:hypothetical protein